jgi:hypothetical protein
MDNIISNALKMAKNAQSNMLSLRKKMTEYFNDSEDSEDSEYSKDSNKNIKIFGYLLLMLIIIIVLVMSYYDDATDLSSTSSCVFMGQLGPGNSKHPAAWL